MDFADSESLPMARRLALLTLSRRTIVGGDNFGEA